MNVPSDWLLFGANGYTGRLIAEEAVRRGVKPVLAGRDVVKIEPPADELGCPARVYALDDPRRIIASLSGVRACAPLRETPRCNGGRLSQSMGW